MGEPDATPRPRPTIGDVARAAGVSRSTAARALSGNGYAAADAREKVLAAASTLGYVPDTLAINLRTRKRTSVGVLVSNMQDPFYAALAAGVGNGARQAGYTMLLIDDRGSLEEELAAAKVFLGMRVCGAIVTPLSAAVGDFLTEQGIPVVEVDRSFRAGQNDSVLVDNVGSARRLVDLLINLGHERIALFADELDWTTGAGRLQGYREALGEAGLPMSSELVISAPLDVEHARRASVELLTRPNRPTAVFVANSLLAEGLWRATTDLGLRVPDDLSIVAFDDVPWMSMVTPGVTAVRQDVLTMGENAMQALLARIGDPLAPPQATVVAAQLNVRGSTAPPRMQFNRT